MSDIAFKVLIGNGYDDILFKTIMLKGEKGDAGETEIDDSTISASKTWSSQKINSMIAQTETIENVEIASFNDGADDVPVSDLIVDITAVQAGSGVPSPDNEREILGFDSGVVTVCGINLFDGILEKGYISTTTGEDTPNASGNQWRCKNYIRVKPNMSLYMKLPNGYTTNNSNITVYYYDVNKNFIGYESNKGNTVIQIPSNCHWFRFCNYIVTAIQDAPTGNSLNYPSSDTSYHAYKGNTYTFTFGQTVYGGHFDNKGNLVITHGVVDLGSVYWQYNPSLNVFAYNLSDMPLNTVLLCEQYEYTNVSRAEGIENNQIWNTNYALMPHNILIKDTRYTDTTAFRTAVSGVKLVYELANPIVLSITSQDVATLLGNNNIFANTGKIKKLVYFKKGSEPIARMIEAYMRASN